MLIHIFDSRFGRCALLGQSDATCSNYTYTCLIQATQYTYTQELYLYTYTYVIPNFAVGLCRGNTLSQTLLSVSVSAHTECVTPSALRLHLFHLVLGKEP
jgi:hypothetical protein